MSKWAFIRFRAVGRCYELEVGMLRLVLAPSEHSLTAMGKREFYQKVKCINPFKLLNPFIHFWLIYIQVARI